jgi:phage shock protein C
MQVNARRLYRSRDRQLTGVAGGMAEYLNVDPTVVRVLWILATIVSGGLGLIAYIVLAIITPESPYAAAGPAPVGYPGYGPTGSTAYGPTGYAQTGYAQTGYAAGYAQATSAPGAGTAGWSTPPASPTWNPGWAATAAAQPQAGQQRQAAQQARGRGFGAAAIVGVVLIVIGAIALADAALPGWSSAMLLGPAVIIALGAAIVVASVRRSDTPVAEPAAQATPATPAGEPSSQAAAGAQPADPIETADSTDTQTVVPPAFG